MDSFSKLLVPELARRPIHEFSVDLCVDTYSELQYSFMVKMIPFSPDRYALESKRQSFMYLKGVNVLTSCH